MAGQDAADASDPEELDAAGVAALESAELPLSLSEPLSPFDSPAPAGFLLRLSVTYQPPPLKTTGGAWRTRLAIPLPHSSQVWVVSAEKPCRSSYVAWQAGQ